MLGFTVVWKLGKLSQKASDERDGGKVEIVLRTSDKACREIWRKRALSEADVRETASGTRPGLDRAFWKARVFVGCFTAAAAPIPYTSGS
jgi:hypothetical protein